MLTLTGTMSRGAFDGCGRKPLGGADSVSCYVLKNGQVISIKEKVR